MPGLSPALVFCAVLLPLAAAAKASGGAPVVTPREAELGLPFWVYRPEESRSDRERDYGANHEIVAAHDATGKRYQVVLYGDSYVAWHRRYPTEWKKVFTGMEAAPFGVGSNTIEELAWRLMVGGELPGIPPKNIVLSIGLNNGRRGANPKIVAQRLSYLLTFLREQAPESRLIVMALPLNKRFNVAPFNSEYAKMIKKSQYVHGAEFLNCNPQFNPKNRQTLSQDGLHPTPLGQRVLLNCLANSLFPNRRRVDDSQWGVIDWGGAGGYTVEPYSRPPPGLVPLA